MENLAFVDRDRPDFAGLNGYKAITVASIRAPPCWMYSFSPKRLEQECVQVTFLAACCKIRHLTNTETQYRNMMVKPSPKDAKKIERPRRLN